MTRQIEERKGQLGRFAGDWAAACKAKTSAAQQLQLAKDEQQDRCHFADFTHSFYHLQDIESNGSQNKIELLMLRCCRGPCCHQPCILRAQDAMQWQDCPSDRVLM